MPMTPISKISVNDRYRLNLGDISDLAASMRDVGQLQPIVTTADYRLIAGERRLSAARSLGWTEIDVKIVSGLTDAADLLRAERDENTCRKSFAPTEEHSLYEALVRLSLSSEGKSAKPEKPGQVIEPSGKTRRSIAEIVSGNSGRYKSLEKIGEIKRVANDLERSDRVHKAAHAALAEVDETGNISGAYTRVQLALRAEEARNKADPASWSEEERAIHKRLTAGRTAVVSFRENHANVVRWALAEGRLVSVDRRTEWGNPFELPYDGDRETIIRNYAKFYLPNKPSLTSRLRELRGKALACWCAPEACHADVLMEGADDVGTSR